MADAVEHAPESAVGHIDEDAVVHERTGLAWVGGSVLDLLGAGKQLYSVLVKTLYYSARGVRQPGAVARQMYEIGNQSLVFLSVVMGFIGMILVFQAGLQAKRVVPDLSLLGATFLELLVRDLAASISALMLATRVGAGIAAEIGSMVVTEQVDALRMCAADPVDYLIVPRFKASIVMTTVLVIIAAGVAFTTGMLTGYVFFEINPRTFVNLSMVDAGDLTIGLSKCVAYGAAIPVVSGYCGLSTFGGSEGVGWATTRAVVNSSLTVIIMNFFISGAGYLIFG
ncbi:MAG: ABC transporter permease [Polyangiaceae bacterium]|nr:ABC transporter permease [Polyangiaceae bacterium]MBK8995937.1 ABC transporter permease [Myxococcales bacterium]MCE7893345.1 ABC transporter permease [Sorangiineae bacterium PRO1]MCL4756556.1 ABC transporter permease [Myxococcales bacterium]